MRGRRRSRGQILVTVLLAAVVVAVFVHPAAAAARTPHRPSPLRSCLRQPPNNPSEARWTA
jgi:Tfp pilus assembly protein PilX